VDVLLPLVKRELERGTDDSTIAAQIRMRQEFIDNEAGVLAEFKELKKTTEAWLAPLRDGFEGLYNTLADVKTAEASAMRKHMRNLATACNSEGEYSCDQLARAAAAKKEEFAALAVACETGLAEELAEAEEQHRIRIRDIQDKFQEERNDILRRDIQQGFIYNYGISLRESILKNRACLIVETLKKRKTASVFEMTLRSSAPSSPRASDEEDEDELQKWADPIDWDARGRESLEAGQARSAKKSRII